MELNAEIFTTDLRGTRSMTAAKIKVTKFDFSKSSQHSPDHQKQSIRQGNKHISQLIKEVPLRKIREYTVITCQKCSGFGPKWGNTRQPK